MSLWYLASPYSKLEKEYANQLALDATRALVVAGYQVFSPVVYGHTVEQGLPIEKSWEYWMNTMEPIMGACAGLFVLKVPGWDTSEGVQVEREFFRTQGKSEILLDPEQLGVEV